MDAGTIVVSVGLLSVLGLVLRAIIRERRERRADEQAKEVQDSAAVCEPGGSHLSRAEDA